MSRAREPFACTLFAGVHRNRGNVFGDFGVHAEHAGDLFVRFRLTRVRGVPFLP